jgi:hypothetical protein
VAVLGEVDAGTDAADAGSNAADAGSNAADAGSNAADAVDGVEKGRVPRHAGEAGGMSWSASTLRTTTNRSSRHENDTLAHSLPTCNTLNVSHDATGQRSRNMSTVPRARTPCGTLEVVPWYLNHTCPLGASPHDSTANSAGTASSAGGRTLSNPSSPGENDMSPAPPVQLSQSATRSATSPPWASRRGGIAASVSGKPHAIGTTHSGSTTSCVNDVGLTNATTMSTAAPIFASESKYPSGCWPMTRTTHRTTATDTTTLDPYMLTAVVPGHP